MLYFLYPVHKRLKKTILILEIYSYSIINFRKSQMYLVHNLDQKHFTFESQNSEQLS